MPCDRSEDQPRRLPGGAGPLIALMTLAVAVLTATSVQSAPPRSPSNQTLAASAEQARPTAAWARFCARHPGECSVDLSEPEIIPLTPEILTVLSATNKRVNDAILPVTDQDHWGVQDRWDYPDDGKGDCEDIQLLKRKLLVERGLPRRAMRMTVVIDRKGEGHAVLTVRTTKGDLILDNARDDIVTWRRTGYEFVKREGSDGRSWVWLDGQSGPAVTAAR